jgi:N-acetylmuramoyl-L-alanine amidase
VRTASTVIILLLTAATIAGAQEVPTVKVTSDASGPSTRLVLTLSRPVVSAVTTVGDRLEIVYAQPVRIVPAERELNDPILLGWSVRGDRTLVLQAGSGYTGYESFELRNPSRTVLDLQGKRTYGTAQVTPSGGDREMDSKTVIVIDPGHGGVENGAIGPGGLREKDVALDLSLRLKAKLQQDPDVTVVLTRDEDRHVDLDERTAIANYNRADLFLSIHLNASRRTGARGAETYFLSAEATDDEARILAGLENGVPVTRKGEAGRSGSNREGLDLILWDLAQNQYLAESSALAESVQKQMNALCGTRNRGVRQAPFRVLMGATMPAILVEVGFISNPEEERQLSQLGYRGRIVEALARAVREFNRGLATYNVPGKQSPVRDD